MSVLLPVLQEEAKQYLCSALLESQHLKTVREIVNLPEGLDYNEWLASHSMCPNIIPLFANKYLSDFFQSIIIKFILNIIFISPKALAFFDHINLLYGTISEFCSMSGFLI